AFVSRRCERFYTYLGQGSNTLSRIGSVIETTDEQVNVLLGFTGVATGDSGNIFIDTPSLLIGSGGVISIENNGSGNSGQLSIIAEKVQLAGQISAFTASGQGGNIDVVADSLLLNRDSDINASSAGNGNGGNIIVNSAAIALLPNSRISADANLGSGGQVRITTDILLQSPGSLISATSEGGADLDGMVEVQALNENFRTESEIEPPTIDLPQITAICAQAGSPSGEFIVTGRGGLPTSPSDIQQTYRGWPSTPTVEDTALSVRSSSIVEAQGWLSNGDGTIRFTDQAPDVVLSSSQRTGCINAPTSQNRS
ncbi:MAG: hypothetical protein ABG776_00130, partial [Cyanobacteria bacterium J06555_13]